MWTTPEKHTKRRETLGNANQNKTTRRAGYKVYGEKNQRKHSELKERCEIADKTKNTNNNSYTEEGQRKSTKMNQSNWKGAI